MMMYERMFFLSGLPRTGSTLLASILHQNPEIHTEGQSALCPLMWDMHTSCNHTMTSASHLLRVNHREETGDELLRSIPRTYYENVDRRFVLDKGFNWCVPGNYWMITEWIDPDPRMIILVRPVQEIYASLKRLSPDDPMLHSDKLFKPDTAPLMFPLTGVKYARENNNGNFLFINYHDIVNDTKSTIEKIYQFFGLTLFDHWYSNIVNATTEDDTIHGFSGMHDVRPEIAIEQNRYELTPYELDVCLRLNDEFRVLD